MKPYPKIFWLKLYKKFWQQELIIIILIGLLTTVFTIFAKSLGWLQSLELTAYDQIVNLLPDRGPDDRLLIVKITEADIKAQKKWPISDLVLAQVIEKITQHKPQAIGLDLLRELPNEPGNVELIKQLQNPHVIAITFIGTSDLETVGPPPYMPLNRVGFNDLTLDSDDKLRRTMLVISTEKSTFPSFPLKLALVYLEKYGITSKLNNQNWLQIGSTVFPPLEPKSGGYQNLNTVVYQTLLDYRTPDKIAREVTLTEVLQNQLKPEWVKDKIVLIGVTAKSTKDLFATPYNTKQGSLQKMAGVMIHAQSVSQIISAVLDQQSLFRFWSETQEILWLISWGFMGGLLAAKSRRLLLFLASIIAASVVIFTIAYWLFIQKIWIPIAAPCVALIGTGISTIAYQKQQAKQQQETMMRLLGQQTSPEIAQTLWKESDRLLESGRLPGQTIIATILFSDIRGFSTISESGSPDAIMAWLNEYMGAMTDLVKSHRGIINKFVGDGIMAVFGVPIPSTTHEQIATDAKNAVKCALAMADRLVELNEDWEMRELPHISIRIGIYTGNVMVGSLGSKERLEYAVIGDSVNIASRLESYNKDKQDTNCRILLAKETLAYLEGQLEVEPWGSIQLKGKQQEVQVFRAIGLTINN